MLENREIPVLLVDSECAVCDRLVRFLRKRLGEEKILFRSLFSEEGKKYLGKYGFPEDYDRSVVYINRDRAYVESEAVLRITRKMRGLYPLLSVFLVFPRWIRDPFYRLIARHRHRISV